MAHGVEKMINRKVKGKDIHDCHGHPCGPSGRFFCCQEAVEPHREHVIVEIAHFAPWPNSLGARGTFWVSLSPTTHLRRQQPWRQYVWGDQSGALGCGRGPSAPVGLNGAMGGSRGRQTPPFWRRVDPRGRSGPLPPTGYQTYQKTAPGPGGDGGALGAVWFGRSGLYIS